MSFTPRLGWIPFEERTSEQMDVHAACLQKMPTFQISNASGVDEDRPAKFMLTDLWKHELVVKALGYVFPRIHQVTGSCVGAGGGNVIFTVSCVEVIKFGEPERIVVPFWLLPYGLSRKMFGMRGRGEGSGGSYFAEAVKIGGCPHATLPGLPKFTNRDGLVWSEQAEYQYSNYAEAPADLIKDSKSHLIKNTALLKTPIDVRDSIYNCYPITIATNRYIGNPRVQGTGDEAVLIGKLDTRGGHQTSILGVWNHPQFGWLYLYSNQWPESVYPRDPAGGPPCSCWMTESTLLEILASGETYAFSQYDGYQDDSPAPNPFPAQKLRWLI